MAHKLKYPKPALIHGKFIPSLGGAQSKMSASSEMSSVFMNDTQKKLTQKVVIWVHSQLILDQQSIFGWTGGY